MELFYSNYWENPPVTAAAVHYFADNSRHHYHFHYHCKMHLCYLKILLTAPLCNMIPCLLQLILSSFYRHIFFSSLIPSFSFFTRTKGLRIHLRPSNSLDLLFMLIFISIVVYTEAVVHRYSSK